MIVALFLLFHTAVAHIIWQHPQPRDPIAIPKGPYPCGNFPFHGTGQPVTTLKPGLQVLEISETVTHTGAPMRIALSMNDDNGYDNFVMLAHLPHPDNAAGTPYTLKFVVDIPDINCPKCSLQALSMMTDKIGANKCCEYPSNKTTECFSVYHSCANVKITGTATALPTPPVSGAAMTTVWATQEGSMSAWSNVATKEYMLDKQYASFLPTRCSCNATSCVRSGAVGPMINPLKLPGASTTTTTALSTTTKSTTSSKTTTKSTKKTTTMASQTPSMTSTSTVPKTTLVQIDTTIPPSMDTPAATTPVGEQTTTTVASTTITNANADVCTSKYSKCDTCAGDSTCQWCSVTGKIGCLSIDGACSTSIRTVDECTPLTTVVQGEQTAPITDTTTVVTSNVLSDDSSVASIGVQQIQRLNAFMLVVLSIVLL